MYVQVVDKVKKMRQGAPLGGGVVDCGAMCMPGLAEKVAELVDDAVAEGAQVYLHGHCIVNCRIMSNSDVTTATTTTISSHSHWH